MIPFCHYLLYVKVPLNLKALLKLSWNSTCRIDWASHVLCFKSQALLTIVSVVISPLFPIPQAPTKPEHLWYIALLYVIIYYVFLELRFKSEAGLGKGSISSDKPLLSPVAPRAPSTKPGSQCTSKSKFKCMYRWTLLATFYLLLETEPGMTVQTWHDLKEWEQIRKYVDTGACMHACMHVY